MLLIRLVAVAFLFSYSALAEDLRLVYPHFPPYTKQQQPLAAGNFLVEKIMQQLQQGYSTKQVPNYKRALSEVQYGEADGFFFASQNSQRDSVAVFSKSVLYNNWSWFFRYDRYLNPYSRKFKSDAKVASIEGTNTLRWLNTHHYHVVGKQSNVAKLAIMLFDLERIDAAFMSADVFKSSEVHPNLVRGEYIEVVQRSAPFGIYISKAYLEQHPGFMQRLNSAIDVVQKTYLDSSYTLPSLIREP
ncbi:hypothetical protein [Agarivorans sp. DSG3-1]|uniref:hypothetical protein n=1 Tax=Agarivorans sp. DSG3-1 TaxID=3342249 RepID=UPI00398F56D5